MDRIDCLILDAMQHNARIAIADLAERVGASTASVQRRLKRMRTNGTIKAEVAVIDPRRSGFSITALITVELERDSAERTDAFKRRAASARDLERQRLRDLQLTGLASRRLDVADVVQLAGAVLQPDG